MLLLVIREGFLGSDETARPHAKPGEQSKILGYFGRTLKTPVMPETLNVREDEAQADKP